MNINVFPACSGRRQGSLQSPTRLKMTALFETPDRVRWASFVLIVLAGLFVAAQIFPVVPPDKNPDSSLSGDRTVVVSGFAKSPFPGELFRTSLHPEFQLTCFHPESTVSALFLLECHHDDGLTILFPTGSPDVSHQWILSDGGGQSVAFRRCSFSDPGSFMGERQEIPPRQV